MVPFFLLLNNPRRRYRGKEDGAHNGGVGWVAPSLLLLVKSVERRKHKKTSSSSIALIPIDINLQGEVHTLTTDLA